MFGREQLPVPLLERLPEKTTCITNEAGCSSSREKTWANQLLYLCYGWGMWESVRATNANWRTCKCDAWNSAWKAAEKYKRKATNNLNYIELFRTNTTSWTNIVQTFAIGRQQTRTSNGNGLSLMQWFDPSCCMAGASYPNQGDQREIELFRQSYFCSKSKLSDHILREDPLRQIAFQPNTAFRVQYGK